MKCRVEHEKTNSISTSNHVLFCLSCKHNSPSLTRKVNYLTNENKRIDNPQIKIVKYVGAKVQDEKYVEYGRNFQYKKLLVIDFVLTDRGNLSGTRLKRPVANLSVVAFRSQPREMPLPKPLNTPVTFLYFDFLPLLENFERHCR